IRHVERRLALVDGLDAEAEQLAVARTADALLRDRARRVAERPRLEQDLVREATLAHDEIGPRILRAVALAVAPAVLLARARRLADGPVVIARLVRFARARRRDA